MSASALTVEFAGTRRDVTDVASLVFGRGADLDIDSNPFLHRHVGRLVVRDDLWWVECLGEWTRLTVTSAGCSAQLDTAQAVPLTHPESIIRFDAGACNYEIRIHLHRPPDVALIAAAPPTPGLTATYRPLDLPLTDEQRLMVTALAEVRLRTPGRRGELPSNVAAAARLGWSTAKFNRKLDWLCHRLHQAGVAGMKAQGRRANARRLHVVDHLIGNGSITVADLDLLEEHVRRLHEPDPSRDPTPADPTHGDSRE